VLWHAPKFGLQALDLFQAYWQLEHGSALQPGDELHQLVFRQVVESGRPGVLVAAVLDRLLGRVETSICFLVHPNERTLSAVPTVSESGP
jgi:hypothetical protein